jgi:hypothetical protein
VTIERRRGAAILRADWLFSWFKIDPNTFREADGGIVHDV